ncbi:MAG: hypothetical protein ACM3SQ_02315 [Betaproteobacteria bacterium]
MHPICVTCGARGTVLHVADGDGSLLPGDIVQVVMDRLHVS